MQTFEFTRPADAAGAIALAAKATTAQQGADIRLIAGGTTLVDLMKLSVETPQHLVDVHQHQRPLGCEAQRGEGRNGQGGGLGQVVS